MLSMLVILYDILCKIDYLSTKDCTKKKLKEKLYFHCTLTKKMENTFQTEKKSSSKLDALGE
jgi:hypothetical protein